MGVFEEDEERYIDLVLSYFKHCMDTVATEKRICVYPKHKPWMMSEVQSLLRAWNSALRSGDVLYSRARSDLKNASEAQNRITC